MYIYDIYTSKFRLVSIMYSSSFQPMNCVSLLGRKKIVINERQSEQSNNSFVKDFQVRLYLQNNLQ